MQVEASKIVDPLAPITDEFLQDPYPSYKHLREHAPVFWNESQRWWLISKYEDVSMVLRDKRFSRTGTSQDDTSRLHAILQNVPSGRLRHALSQVLDRRCPVTSHWFALKGPAEHVRMRSLFKMVFSHDRIQALRPFISDLSNQLLDQAQSQEHFDIMADYAFPLPFKVIAKLLGLPDQDLQQIEAWCLEMIPLFDFQTMGGNHAKAVAAIEEFGGYLAPLVKKRKRAPSDDGLTAMVVAEADGSKLTDRQIAANTVLFMFSGFETTEALIGNGMYALLLNPDQLDLLRSNPDLIDSAVEELLRYDSPVSFIPYLVSERLELRGNILNPNDTVYLLVNSANRDPDAFENPDTLDIERRNNKHLSFGLGSHFCIGANLARLEAQIAINSLLKRAKNVRLASSNIKYRSNLRPRKLSALPVFINS